MGKLTVTPLFFWVIKNIVSGFSPLNQSFDSKNEVSRMPVSHWRWNKKTVEPTFCKDDWSVQEPSEIIQEAKKSVQGHAFFFPQKHRVHIEIKRCGRCGRCQVNQRCEPFGTGCPVTFRGDAWDVSYMSDRSNWIGKICNPACLLGIWYSVICSIPLIVRITNALKNLCVCCLGVFFCLLTPTFH